VSPVARGFHGKPRRPLAALDYDARYVLAYCDGGYTTNMPLADLTGGRAWVAFGYGGNPLGPEHGGPARLLVPHLYFWKSAKWIRGLRLRDTDEPGFWENYAATHDGFVRVRGITCVDLQGLASLTPS
jgi:DMSO/TMAO reductase YedYZ molybdopterin-dependent catalytic subunit